MPASVSEAGGFVHNEGAFLPLVSAPVRAVSTRRAAVIDSKRRMARPERHLDGGRLNQVQRSLGGAAGALLATEVGKVVTADLFEHPVLV
jgi:hypothetical protein